MGVHLELELRRKGVWGQTLRSGLSFLPVSLSEIVWGRQPGLGAEQSRREPGYCWPDSQHPVEDEILFHNTEAQISPSLGVVS